MFSDGSRGVMQLRVVLPQATVPLVCLNKSIVGLPRCLVSSGFNHLILQKMEQNQLFFFVREDLPNIPQVFNPHTYA